MDDATTGGCRCPECREGPRTWRDRAARWAGRRVRWAAARLDPDGNVAEALYYARAAASGHYAPRCAWRGWASHAAGRRAARRRAHAVRVLGRLDGVERTMAHLYGWQARRPATPAHPHPGWALRRARLVRRVTRAVAGGYLRPAAVPGAWTVAAAVADHLDLTEAGDGNGGAVPGEGRRGHG